MQPIDPLEPEDLPMDPREAAMLLLGMTAGELKSIDEKVVSGRNSVGGIRSDINKIVSDIRSIKPQQPLHHVPPPTPVPVIETAPLVVPAPQVTVENNDTDQLEFDFYKKIKPEDLEYQLRLLKSSIDNLETKVNIIIDLIKKKDLSQVDGTINQ